MPFARSVRNGKKMRTRYFLVSKISGHEFSVETDHMWTALEEVLVGQGTANQLPECMGELWGICSEMISDRPVEAIGFWDEEQLYAEMQRYVEEQIHRQEGSLVITSIEKKGDGTTVAEAEIQIADLLRKILREGLSGWEFDAEICSYVEACLLQYADTGVWQTGTVCDWFAPLGQAPQQPWVIEDNGELSDFWQETDTWQWMRYIGNFSDSFLTWYTGECDCSIPDMEKILDMRQGISE